MDAVEELAHLVANAVLRLPSDKVAKLAADYIEERHVAVQQAMYELLNAAEALQEHCDLYINGCPICGRKGTSRGDWTHLRTSAEIWSGDLPRSVWKKRHDYPQRIGGGVEYERPYERDRGYEEEWHGQIVVLCTECFEHLLDPIADEIERQSRFSSRRHENFIRRIADLYGRPVGAPIRQRPAVDAYFADLPAVEGLVKIGKAVCAEDRLSQLGLRAILIEPGGNERERVLHQRFADLRVLPQELPTEIPTDGRTEWFERRGSLAHYLSVAQPEVV